MVNDLFFHAIDLHIYLLITKSDNKIGDVTNGLH